MRRATFGGSGMGSFPIVVGFDMQHKDKSNAVLRYNFFLWGLMASTCVLFVSIDVNGTFSKKVLK